MAQHWLQQYQQGLDPRRIITQAIQSMQQQEQALEAQLCQPQVA